MVISGTSAKELFFYQGLSLLVVLEFIASCGFKSSPQPIIASNQAQASLEFTATSLPSLFIGDDLVINFDKTNSNWQSIAIYRSYLPADCQPCFFKEEFIAEIDFFGPNNKPK